MSDHIGDLLVVVTVLWHGHTSVKVYMNNHHIVTGNLAANLMGIAVQYPGVYGNIAFELPILYPRTCNQNFDA